MASNIQAQEYSLEWALVSVLSMYIMHYGIVFEAHAKEKSDRVLR